MNSNQNEKICKGLEISIIIGVDIDSEVQYAKAFDWRGVEFGIPFLARGHSMPTFSAPSSFRT